MTSTAFSRLWLQPPGDVARPSSPSAARPGVSVASPQHRVSWPPAVASTSGRYSSGDGLPELQRRLARAPRRLHPAAAAGARAGARRSYGCGELDGPERPLTPLLDTVDGPAQLKNLSSKELSQLSDELRSETIFRVPALNRGGRLESSLGVVELTVALHHVFDAPQDRILWDVGHQAIPHKILTGRRRAVHTAGQTGGLSGFTDRFESQYDAFGGGHSSASISAGLGMAVGRDLKGRDNHVISVIGDGAMSAGQAFEAMSNAGYLESNMIVILNDSKADSVASSRCGTISRLQASRSLRELRTLAKNVTKQLSGAVHELAAKVDEVARGLISGSGACLFDELGLYYIGPVDGHNIQHLVTILSEVKATRADGPVLIHIVTEKGRGYHHHDQADEPHGFNSIHAQAHHQSLQQASQPQVELQLYSTYFAQALIAEAEADSDIVGIHAAMPGALNKFTDRFPERCFDVGVAEQHAVTFAAGLACEGLKPFCAIHSSFLQRAYDQVIHDVDLQRLPVRFAIDSAGLVGTDGPTHAGSFDVTYMACLPSMVVMAPSDEAELFRMVATAAAIDDRPSCFRYPRGNGVGVEIPADKKGVPLEAIGKGRILVEGTQVALLGYGSMVQSCLAAQAILAQHHGVSVTVADPRFCKPLDRDLIRRLAREHHALLTVEEGAIGGFGSHVAQFMALDGLLDGNLKWRPLVLPDYYIGHGSHEDQLAQAGLSVAHIAATVLTVLGKKREALHMF